MPVARFTAGVLAVIVIGATIASAAPERRTLHRSRTFPLAAHTTKTFRVGYPEALKYGGSKYAGSVSVLPPHGCPKGVGCPRLSRVHVLSKGSCEGGSDFCARVRNANRGSSVHVRLTATTVLPAGKTP